MQWTGKTGAYAVMDVTYGTISHVSVTVVEIIALIASPQCRGYASSVDPSTQIA